MFDFMGPFVYTTVSHAVRSPTEETSVFHYSVYALRDTSFTKKQICM